MDGTRFVVSCAARLGILAVAIFTSILFGELLAVLYSVAKFVAPAAFLGQEQWARGVACGVLRVVAVKLGGRSARVLAHLAKCVARHSCL
jgi:hypothetical protein